MRGRRHAPVLCAARLRPALPPRRLPHLRPPQARWSPAVEGLYFVRSDADNSLVGGAGNLLTDFHFHHAKVDIEQSESRAAIDVRSENAPARVGIDLLAPPELPEGSPFGSLFEAKSVLRYKPYAFAPDGQGGVRTLRVRRDELAWQSKLVSAETDFTFFRGRDVAPEVHYQVEPIDYRWEKAAA